MYRTTISDEEYSLLLNKIYSIIYEFGLFMPEYSHKWLNSLLKDTYRLNLKEFSTSYPVVGSPAPMIVGIIYLLF